MGNGQAAVELRGGLIVHSIWAYVFASALCAAVLTALTLVYARRRGLVDEPGERRSHDESTPRGGGLSIVLVLAAGLGFLATRTHSFVALSALGGLLGVALVGWLDDHGDLSIGVRLLVHALAAALLAWGSGLAPGGSALVFAFALVLINVWNFMDGINGLAASQAAVFAAVSAVLLSAPIAGTVSLLLLGACVGFLPFNFPRARIFLGDVGSGALGFLIAALLTLGMLQSGGPWGRLPLWFPLAPFLVDAGWTLLSRMVKGEAWWTAHVSHVYQQLARQSGAHTPVTLGYLAVALAGGAIAWVIESRDVDFIKISLMLWYITLSVVWWVLRKQGVARTF